MEEWDGITEKRNFDIEFIDVETVSLELALPGIEVVPEQRSKLTKTGKISYRNMAKKDRRAMYGNLCCGLALRLVHEAFRVLPVIQHVNVLGVGQGGDGQRVCALRHDAARDVFTRVAHGELEASELLLQAGGAFVCGKDGSLSHVPAE